MIFLYSREKKYGQAITHITLFYYPVALLAKYNFVSSIHGKRFWKKYCKNIL